jgi:glycolate oxidase iron-sulfur subunit
MAAVGPSSLSTILSAEEEKILACVHCGLCLEACPTYVATSDENDGPRGRIYLMRAVQEGRLPVASSSFETHIDRCLGCRACESACPAGVQYGQLLEAARAEIMQSRPRRGAQYSLLRFLLRHVWTRPRRLRALFGIARLVRDFGIARVLLKTNLPREVSPQFEFGLALLEGSGVSVKSRKQKTGRMPVDRPQDAGAPGGAPAKTQPGDSVLLFRGCVTDGLFRRVNDATRRVLEVNRYTVQAPPEQVCCGALHAHAGDLEGARKLARANIDAFEENSPDKKVASIVTNAGGCGAMLLSYAHLLADDQDYSARAAQFSARIQDIGQQLHGRGFRNGVSVGVERITYDASCHLLHGQHAADTSLQMLWAIPDLNFALLRDSEVCCGGAGVYNLLEPELSQEVLAAKLDCIKQTGAEILATGNAGCHMQIAAGANLQGMKLRVCHPIELLDESYRRAGYYD